LKFSPKVRWVSECGRWSTARSKYLRGRGMMRREGIERGERGKENSREEKIEEWEMGL
jgi:hypothetical protein